MSLGLLARDSILDLTMLGGDESVTTSCEDSQRRVDSSSPSKKTDPVRTADRQEESKVARYTGFGVQNDWYESYGPDPYAPAAQLGPRSTWQRPTVDGMMCCLFPWTSKRRLKGPGVKAMPSQAEVDASLENENVDSARASERVSQRSEEDERSSNSDALGEKLSDKERQAVLARLGLAQPDESDQSQAPEEKPPAGKKGLLNEIFSSSPVTDSTEDSFASYGDDPLAPSKPLKSILKRASTGEMKRRTSTLSKQHSSDESSTGTRRRSLFPTYGSTTSTTSHKLLKVSFAPMARVVSVKSKDDMDEEEKSDVWWQRSDYEDFRRTGRMITKAMLEGGSEIWLSKELQSLTDSIGDTVANTGDKWWHRFGHSRRGLEHVVSVEEGRDRQTNVRTAIRAVIAEQHKQRTQHREDAEKLRMVALNHTSWARDLALASGASDADAVKSEFAEGRKSREFFLLKMARLHKNGTLSAKLPSFMQPHFSQMRRAPQTQDNSRIQQRMLDANTASQLSYMKKVSRGTLNGKQDRVSCEPIRDSEAGGRTNMAARAAGFTVDGEKVNMAAVLSGMGAMPQNATTAVAN